MGDAPVSIGKHDRNDRMRIVLTVLAMAGVIWRRVVSHLGLLLAVWAGFTLAVALVVSIPVYAEASGYRILLAALAAEDTPDPLPPFSMIYTYGGGVQPSITWAGYKQADALGSDLPGAGIALPVEQTVRYAASEKLRLMFPEEQQSEVLWARLAFVSGFEQQVQLVQGDWPDPNRADGVVDVIVSETSANKYTLLVEDIYRLHTARGSRIDLNLPVRIAGIWRPINPDGDYWFLPPAAFSDALLTPEAAFARALDHPEIPWVKYASWYTALDFTAVRTANIPRLAAQIDRATGALDRIIPGVALTRSPAEALEEHRRQVRLLTVTLALFSVPLLGLIWYFTLQVGAMVVQRQQQEIAVLRSRGSSRLEVLAMALGEGFVLGAAAVLAGVPLGVAAAQLILWTESFLRFTVDGGPAARLLPASWRHGVLVVLVALPAILIPALRASRRTIISYKQERARSSHVPLWQRLFLDILLLAPALYGYQQLRNNRMIGVPGITQVADDPFRNPVLMLAPALLVFALALFALRIIPIVLALLTRVLKRAPGIALLALQFLGRTPQGYSSLVLLIMLTLSLAVFTASMARTLDQYSVDRARYAAGADVRLVYKPPEVAAGSNPTGASGTGAVSLASLDYLLVPPDEYLKIPGVNAVSRVASSSVWLVPAAAVQEEGVFLGVDRARLPGVLQDSWRDDYAAESLGMLMNRLASDPSAALVLRDYAERHGLREGDRLALRMNDVGETREVPFVIAGLVEYFPTLYAEEAPFVIGNLDYSFEALGATYAYQIWLDVGSSTAVDAIAAEAFGYGLGLVDETPTALIEADRQRPERQGLFGLLSVGFMAAALVTVIGFLAHTLLSFQRRLVELGMLRAIGLGSGQLASLLIYEQTLVIVLGTSIGTALGVLASRLFMPFLRVRAGQYPDTPPFVTQIAWDQIALVYGVAGGLLAITVGVTVVLLRRMRIFEAVKLGEAV